jgi:hypothetical protein
MTRREWLSELSRGQLMLMPAHELVAFVAKASIMTPTELTRHLCDSADAAASGEAGRHLPGNIKLACAELDARLPSREAFVDRHGHTVVGR